MSRFREAVVLAGGFGTRLSHIVSDVPKPMAPVAERPFLRFILDYLDERDFSRVVIADGYKRECIEDYFGNSYRGLEIAYSSEEEPLLTGGAIKKALSVCSSEWVYVLNGDTYVEADFDLMDRAAYFGAANVDVVMVSKEMHDFDRYGTIEVSLDGRVDVFHEKRPCEKGLINAGVYLLRKNALDAYPKKFSFETECLEALASRGGVVAVACDGEFIDIGIPEDYNRAQTMLAPMAKKWKLAMFDRDGTINVDTGHLHEPEKLVLIPECIELLRGYSNEPNTKIVVVTNQAGIARGYYGEPEMRKLNAIIAEQLEEAGCRIDAWYFCPHHPDFTGECQCRKPRPGMLKKAMADFDASPQDCVMYGDSRKDMDAAKAAGVRGVLVNWV